MDKLTKELKESGRYEYSKPIQVKEGMYQDFISHDNSEVSVGILEKLYGGFVIEILHIIKDSNESNVRCKLFHDASLKEVERLIKVLFKEWEND